MNLPPTNQPGEERMRTLKERIQLAVEVTGLGTWEYDPVTHNISIDQQCRYLFGILPDEEATTERMLSVFNPEDLIRRQEALKSALAGENDGTYDLIYRIHPYGSDSTRWIRSKGKVFFTKNGTSYRLIGTMLDVTQQVLSEQLLKESEARFRLAADSTTAMIRMCNGDLKCNYFNKSWLEFRGRNAEQEKGSGWLAGIHPADKERLLLICQSHMAERSNFSIEYRLANKDGQYHWIADAAIARFSPEGFFEGYISTCTDIHDQKISTQELENLITERTHSLQHAVHQLEVSNENLEEFAYIASHDLQEPLRKIRVFSSRLLENKDSIDIATRDKYLAKITDAAERMGQLIRDVLDYSKLKDNAIPMAPVDLNEVMNGIAAEFELQIEDKKATLNIGTMPVINGIAYRMHQLFHNLFSNALKFAKKDIAPVISVTAETLSPEEVISYPGLSLQYQYSRITFTDNGIGFDPAFAEKAFQIFQRLHTRDSYEGTGIGLALCRKIVLNHQGIITARSGENAGTSFIVILPLAIL